MGSPLTRPSSATWQWSVDDLIVLAPTLLDLSEPMRHALAALHAAKTDFKVFAPTMVVCRFPRKLTGAKARLFAAGCEHFVTSAADDCNSDPDDVPIFSWLSPQQRLSLIKDVAVGLLCEDEPLPPETIQHFAAYRAMVMMIKVEIEVELDVCMDMEDIGEDLMPGHTGQVWAQRTTKRSEAEKTEWAMKRSLIEHQAERLKEKLETKGTSEPFRPAEQETSIGDLFGRMGDISAILFSGPPISKEERAAHRPLTREEEIAFSWRRLADAACQEHAVGFPPFLDLRKTDFDWRSFNLDKWSNAIDVLFITFGGFEVDKREEALVWGRIDKEQYADYAQHPRILEVERIVKGLRDDYDNQWDASTMAADQRIIWAVCTEELYHTEPHKAFARAFVTRCKEKRIKFRARGQYQQRLALYREIADDFTDGLDSPFTGGHFGQLLTPPLEFKTSKTVFGGCHRQWCFDYKQEDLKMCSRCKVVSYCSRECQVKDWPAHKKMCKQLASLRKDKEQISEFARKL